MNNKFIFFLLFHFAVWTLVFRIELLNHYYQRPYYIIQWVYGRVHIILLLLCHVKCVKIRIRRRRLWSYTALCLFSRRISAATINTPTCVSNRFPVQPSHSQFNNTIVIISGFAFWPRIVITHEAKPIVAKA